MAHRWGRWLHNPCRLKSPKCFKAGGGGVRKGPQMGRSQDNPAAWGVPTASERGTKSEMARKWGGGGGGGATLPLPLGGSSPLQSGGQHQKWRTSGAGGYITLAAWEVPTASARVTKSEVAHRWARWLQNPCRLGGPNRFSPADKIRNGPQMGQLANPCRRGGGGGLQRRGQNQKWPKCGLGGYITPAAWGYPPLQSAGGPNRFLAGEKIRNGPQVGRVAR